MLKNLKEVVIAILPMTLLIVILTFIFAPLDSDEMISFLFGAGIMMIGMTLFLFGADYSMMEVGRLVGKYMIKKNSHNPHRFRIYDWNCNHDCRTFRSSVGTTSQSDF